MPLQAMRQRTMQKVLQIILPYDSRPMLDRRVHPDLKRKEPASNPEHLAESKILASPVR
jgi:hypothetical protein